ncbi:GATA type zinc finger [Ceratobasidium sp. AG-Ba]|nr:GATA type zinc finger [Ceratobasidium sp. AG-Ba]
MLESYKWMAYPADPAPTHTTHADLNHTRKSSREITETYHSSRYTTTSSLDGLFWSESDSEDLSNQGAHGSRSSRVRTGLLESKNGSQSVSDHGVQNTGAYWEASVDTIHNEGKYKNGIKISPHTRCHSCNTIDTPEWRRGPKGQRTLCNACGLQYAKLLRKRESIINSLPAEIPRPPPINIEFLRKSARAAAENSTVARSVGHRREAERNTSGGCRSGQRVWGGTKVDINEPMTLPKERAFIYEQNPSLNFCARPGPLPMSTQLISFSHLPSRKNRRSPLA